MSTRSRIAIKTRSGYKSIYCHFDGYPSGVGRTLRDHYTNRGKVNRLIALGNISILGKEIGKKQDFDNPTEGWTVAYHRDRGESKFSNAPKLSRSMQQLSALCDSSGVDYLYIFEDNEWKMIKA